MGRGLDAKLYVGIDVGTASARAGVFTRLGELLGRASSPIRLAHPQPDFAEHSSADIWTACGLAARQALAAAGADPSQVGSVGFDATCSLVAVGYDDQPVSVSPSGMGDQDVICWMDHRAIAEADLINATGHEVLSRVGGTISPEMQLPKLLWLKRHLPATWSAALTFFDLPDWLVHKATGSNVRSLCSTVCKWTYLGERGVAGEGWDASLFGQIGLDDLLADGFRRIGSRLAGPGELIGRLSPDAAEALGLAAGIPVAAGAIDAHAGATGTLGLGAAAAVPTGRVAVIAGTSTCHIVVSDQPHEMKGVWGPYFSVVEPGRWANEGGQSAAGALVDRLTLKHPAIGEVQERAKRMRRSTFDVLEERLIQLAPAAGSLATLTADYHVQPDFLGNRSPIADPGRKGAISGLGMEQGEDDLAILYLATLQALAYGTRQILEAMEHSGLAISDLVVSGGLAKNGLFLGQLADATGLPVIVPRGAEPVLLGAAMLGAVAAHAYPSLRAAMVGMAGGSSAIAPNVHQRSYHDRKYRVFLRMQADLLEYRSLMNSEESR